MAEYEKKSVNEIIQALDALSRTLSQARANRRTSPRSLSRSGSSRSGGDAAAVDAVTPRPLFRSASTKDRYYDAGAAAGEGSPRPRVPRRSSAPTSPFPAKPNKLDKNDEDDGDSAESAHSEQLKSQGFTAVTPADAEEKTTRGMRRMGCLCSVEVVAAQGLPPSTVGLRLSVTVRKKETRDGAVQTMTARVRLGAADFDEALYVRCHLYGTGTGFEPRPFMLSLVVHAPELDMGRSTVDLSLFAKEFTEKCRQGESFQQWDMAIPLAGKAKGGELVIKLAFQSIVDESAPKMARAKTLKVDVPAPDLMSVDSFKLDDLEAETTPTEEVKEMQQTQADDEPTPVAAEVKEEEQEKESDHKQAADEPTPVVEVNEEQQKEQDHEPTDDEHTSMVEMKEEEQQKEVEREPVDDDHTPVTEVKEDEEQQKELEHEPVDGEHTPVTEVKEEERWNEPEHEPVDDEHTPLVEVKEEDQQKEPKCEPADDEPKEEEKQEQPESEPDDESTPVAEVVDEQQKELEVEPAHYEPTPVVKVVEEEKQKELESEPAHEPTPMVEVEEEEKQNEPKSKTTDESTPVAEVNEAQQQKEPEHDPEDAQEDDDSEAPKVDVIDKDVDEQEVKDGLEEEVDAKKEIDDEEDVSLTPNDEVAKTVANGLEEKSFEESMPNDVSDAAIEAVEPVDDVAALPEEVIKESLQVAEQRGDKGASRKTSRPPLKWRTVALLVPVSVLFSKTIGAN